MSSGELGRRFLATTRGRLVGILQRGPGTVEELAEKVGLTKNAVRSHLSALERDGLVRHYGTRRGTGAGKPAAVYALDPEAELRFSRAYAPVLRALVEETAEQLSADQVAKLMRGLGHRLAAGLGKVPRGSLAARVNAGAELLNALGGAAEVERSGDAFVIRGCGGCPLSAVTAGQPELCRALETLLTEYVGARVTECCERGERPRCRFEVEDVPTAA